MILAAALGAAALQMSAGAAPADRLGLSNNRCLVEACLPASPVPPAITPAGQSFGLYVAALDPNGRDITYTGSVVFSGSDPLATLPQPFTFSPADEGGRSLTAVLRSLGPQSITVRDSQGILAPGTLVMTVTGPGAQVGVPTLSRWMQIFTAAVLGSVGIWFLRHKG